jgi:hypothetical protein
MKIFASVHAPAEEHGDEHNLPRAEVGHVYSSKEMPQILILQKLVILL